MSLRIRAFDEAGNCIPYPKDLRGSAETGRSDEGRYSAVNPAVGTFGVRISISKRQLRDDLEKGRRFGAALRIGRG